jgi:Flp pilus assembly protein TadD
MRTTVLALCAGVFLAATLARAQATCTAEGFVLDGDGNPLAGVQVLMQYKGHIPQKYRTKTDKSGKFVHVNVWEGIYDLTFAREGQGEVTVKDYRIRQINPPEKPPTFRIGAPKAAQDAAAGEPGAPGAPPAGPTPEQRAAAIAGELDRGNAALAAGNVDEAVLLYEGVAAKAPDIPQVQHNLGLAYRKKGDLPKAEAAFRKAAELDPKFAEPHGALSVMLAGAGKRDEALAEAEKAVALSPDSSQYLYNLAVLYRDSGRAVDAEPVFLKLEQLEPQNVEIQYHLATAYMGQGRIQDALARLEKYVASAPADAANLPAAKAMIAALQKKK